MGESCRATPEALGDYCCPHLLQSVRQRTGKRTTVMRYAAPMMTTIFSHSCLAADSGPPRSGTSTMHLHVRFVNFARLRETGFACLVCELYIWGQRRDAAMLATCIDAIVCLVCELRRHSPPYQHCMLIDNMLPCNYLNVMITPELFSSKAATLSFRFDEIVRLISRRVDARLIDYGLSRTQWRLLVYVMRDEGLTQSALARVADLERATIGQTIDLMERKGLVERTHAVDDRRVWRILSTPKARALIGEPSAVVEEILGHMFDGFAESEIAALEAQLDRLVANLTECPPSPQQEPEINAVRTHTAA